MSIENAKNYTGYEDVYRKHHEIGEYTHEQRKRVIEEDACHFGR